MADVDDLSVFSEEESYIENATRRKRRRTRQTRRKPSVLNNQSPEAEPFSFEHLADALSTIPSTPSADFDVIFGTLGTEFLTLRNQLFWQNADVVPNQQRTIRAMTLAEINACIREVLSRGELTPPERLLIYRLETIARRRYDKIQKESQSPFVEAATLDPALVDPPPEVLDGLYGINTTPYKNSFASRLYGSNSSQRAESIHLRDWETRTVWLDMCEEIRLHYYLLHGTDEHLIETSNATIDYAVLERGDLQQVHDLLQRIFWEGIRVNNIMDAPENCTVVARYKKLVVGVALFSAPGETYITYVAVRPGWDYHSIATFMIFLLIKKNPRKDVFLHVSANNPAMLLYNKFGFKAEEFIVGFYDDYLPPNSKSSKNAFRLRLRQY